MLIVETEFQINKQNEFFMLDRILIIIRIETPLNNKHKWKAVTTRFLMLLCNTKLKDPKSLLHLDLPLHCLIPNHNHKF